jgi:hypothetical protein
VLDQFVDELVNRLLSGEDAAQFRQEFLSEAPDFIWSWVRKLLIEELSGRWGESYFMLLDVAIRSGKR